MRLKPGDTTPSVSIRCTDNGTAVNLTTANDVRVLGYQAGELVIDNPDPDVDEAGGLVTHRWEAADTVAPGRMWFEVKVIWGDLRPQTFPPYGRLPVDIEP